MRLVWRCWMASAFMLIACSARPSLRTKMAKEKEPQLYQGTTEDQRLRVKVHLTVKPDQLELDYQLDAKMERLVVFDALWSLRADGAQELAPSLAFVSFVPPSTLALRRVIPPLPQHKDVERAYLPWCRAVQPGQGLSGNISLVLPAFEYSPYYLPHPKAVYRNETATSVLFELAYAALDQVKVEPIPGNAERLRCLPGQAPIIRLPIQIELDRPLPVRRRSDRFEPI